MVARTVFVHFLFTGSYGWCFRGHATGTGVRALQEMGALPYECRSKPERRRYPEAVRWRESAQSGHEQMEKGYWSGVWRTNGVVGEP